MNTKMHIRKIILLMGSMIVVGMTGCNSTAGAVTKQVIQKDVSQQDTTAAIKETVISTDVSSTISKEAESQSTGKTESPTLKSDTIQQSSISAETEQEVVSIQIQNGSNGETRQIEDETERNEVMQCIQNLQFESYEGQEYTGWQFKIIVTSTKDSVEDKVTYTFMGSKCNIIGKGYYNVVNSDSVLSELQGKVTKYLN